MGPMTAWEYHDRLVASLRERRDIEILTFADAIRYNDRNYPWIRVASRDIAPEDPTVLLRCSYHGNEPLGALFFLRRAVPMTEQLHRKGVKYIAYPMADPSGFETGERGGLAANEGYDDWVQYELENGTVVDGLGYGQRFSRWLWSSDPCLKMELSQETALMHRCLRQDLTSRHIIAAVDVHQHTYVKEGDDAEKITKPGMYFYAFGGRKKRLRYNAIVNRVERRVPVLRNTWIAAGYNAPMQTDAYGCIVVHDGSFADACYRAGIHNSTVLEITGATPEALAEETALQWIIGNAEITQHTKT